MPMRQRLHWPQPAWISTVTRCPILYSSTPGPRAATVPMYSWPGVKFLLNGMPPWIEAGGPCQMISRSVAQIATASMRTSTSARFGTGTGFSTSFSSPGSPSTQARIVSVRGMSVEIFTPGGAYIAIVSLFGRDARSGFRPVTADFGGERAHGRDDLLTYERQVIVVRAHRGRGGADRADNRAVVIADGRADADHARLILLVVHRIAVAAHVAQRLDQRGPLGDGLRREALETVRQHAMHVVLRKPGEHRLAPRGRMRRVAFAQRAGIDAHRMA